ncbi:MAG: peptidoglycan DD-metalloendopeptidase family protein [Rhizobiales bacterium]|nr:peptidoglycan DD-metalloendopeptidase family protein [Hyphomicrobiales bacterium]
MSSSRSHSVQRQPVRSPGDKPHTAPRAPHGNGRARPSPHSYTLAHAGRQFRIGPIAFWLTVSALVIMACWSAGTATYFAFRDDLLTRLITRQADMQYAYEDRIADLRAQVDRLTSRQLLDQDQVEKKIDQLVRRQSVLETRAAAISGLPDVVTTGSTKPAAHRPAVRAQNTATPTPKASPISDTVILGPAPMRESNLESRVPGAVRTAAVAAGPHGFQGALARLTDGLNRIEATQTSTLLALEENYDGKIKRIRGVLNDLGIDAGGKGKNTDVGGPFVAASAAHGAAATFERQFQRVQFARASLDRLNRTLVAVPLRKPLAGDLETSSGFGVRMDPFVRSAAMHTGIDLRSHYGEPVRVTAAGKVTVAGWSGGYGKMVEVDHGNGLVTRYGHMSEILVSVDQTVKPGQIVGRVGSTGRSTGPHLHYETRIDGDPVDPHKFLRAGLRLVDKT